MLQAQLLTPLPRVPLPAADPTVPRATTHANRVPAGRLRDGALSIQLDVVESAWRPEGTSDPEVPILAFAERGQAPLVPGPLIRARRGIELRVTLRNRTDSSLVFGGFRPGAADGDDTVQVAAGATRELRHRLGEPGTYWYWGAFAGTSHPERLWKDSQLNGAIVVDEPGAATDDHVLVLSEWFLPYDDGRPFEVVSTINGKGWPHSETVELMQDDSTRFRVINTIPLHHPMHLHGFFYRIESRGDGRRDIPVPPERRMLSNTDLIEPGHTFTLSFVPSTPGNWLFHCHLAFHTDETVTLTESHGHSMRGLVLGLRVKAKAGHAEEEPADAREIRLFVGRSPLRLMTGAAAIGFSVQADDVAPRADSVVLPGPVLELIRGQPVRIFVHNNLDEPTSIHWHGLEIPSYPDGVPHWSGLGDRVYSQVDPGSTFVAAFTPTRAGTYPYHSHLNDRHHINSGMYGALLVLDAPRDRLRDHVIVTGGGGPEIERKIESPYALVNGRRFPDPLRLAVGETHRLRIVTIHPDWRVAYTLRTDSTIAQWRAIAKDGADLPRHLATLRAAHTEMGPGQTEDYEFTPTTPGVWRLEVKSVEPGWHIPLTVIVEPRRSP